MTIIWSLIKNYPDWIHVTGVSHCTEIHVHWICPVLLLLVQVSLQLISSLWPFMVIVFKLGVFLSHSYLMSESTKKCVLIKFCEIRKMPTHTYQLMKTAFDDATGTCSFVFKEGWMSFRSDEHWGHPSATVNSKSVAHLVWNVERLTSWNGWRSRSFHQILWNEAFFHSGAFCNCWQKEQKENCLPVSSNLLECLETDKNFVTDIINR